MKLFKPLYEFALRWAQHPRAEQFLAGLSFIEAFIFPVAPEVMLAPMTLAKPTRWARYASISLLGSLLGSFVGYALGHYAFGLARPFLADIGWLPAIESQVARLASLSAWKIFWMLVLAGFLPIPLKIFTWASGFAGVPFPAFIAGMLVGRGKRVYILCGLIKLGGNKAEAAIHRWIEWIGWSLIALIVLLIVYFRFLR
jgi:membrane protein YqaA with SNARE-associated domain